MKNPAPYLRRTLFTLLNGNVSYESADVPVFETQGEIVPRQVIIGEYSDGDRSNKHTFGANASQVIEVVCEQPTAVRKHVDAIGEVVNDILMPTPQSATLSGSDFRIIVSRPSITHLIEDSGSGTKIVRLILRYNLLISHN